MKARLFPARFSIPLVAALVFSLPQPASAGGDMFLKIGNLKGGATERGYEGWIEVEAFSWGEKQLRTFTSTGRGIAERVTAEPRVTTVTLTKKVDAASPSLLQSATASDSHGEVTLSVYQTDVEPPEYAVVTLKDAIVTSVRPSSMSRGKESLEDVTLSFSRVEVTYKPIDNGG